MTSRPPEELLNDLPTRQIDAAREAELLAAVRAAEGPRGLRRPIALWQGLAAALLGLVIGLFARLPDEAPRPAERGPLPVVVTVEHDLFASGRSTPRLDIARWAAAGPGGQP